MSKSAGAAAERCVGTPNFALSLLGHDTCLLFTSPHLAVCHFVHRREGAHRNDANCALKTLGATSTLEFVDTLSALAGRNHRNPVSATMYLAGTVPFRNSSLQLLADVGSGTRMMCPTRLGEALAQSLSQSSMLCRSLW
jgi:hypothetical protein